MNINLIECIKNEFNYQIHEYLKLNLNELLNLIMNSKGIYFTGIGKSQNMAYHLCDLLKSIGLPCYKLDPINSLHGDVGTLNENDLVLFFSNSGNTKELLPLIQILNTRKCITFGICSNVNSKFTEVCKSTLIIPFKSELICNQIESIPTNSCMSQLLFSNIFVILLIDKMKIKCDSYKLNHPAGNIGDSLKTIRECIITDYPKIIFESSVKLIDVLLKMTEYKTGICIFVDSCDVIKGIILDGDIRRLLIDNNNIIEINESNINTNFIYETNIEKYILTLDKHYKYIPILNKNKNVLGIIKLN